MERLFEGMGEVTDEGLRKWVVGRVEILDWLIKEVCVRGVIDYDNEREVWFFRRGRISKCGRPKVVNDRMKGEIMKRIGDRINLGIRELSRECLDLAGQESVRRGIWELIREGRLVSEESGKGRKKVLKRV